MFNGQIDQIFVKFGEQDIVHRISQTFNDFDEQIYKNSYIKVIILARKNAYWFDQFLDKIYKSDAENIQIVDDNLNMQLLSDDDIVGEIDDTMTILTKYTNGLNLGKDKKSINLLLSKLYNEAIMIEDFS